MSNTDTDATEKFYVTIDENTAIESLRITAVDDQGTELNLEEISVEPGEYALIHTDE